VASILKISSLSKEYVRVPVSATESGQPVDPTGDTVEMAFKTSGEPSGGDWKAASWETDNSVSPVVYYARCLVGPGGTVTLADGTYDVYVRVTDSPEIPVTNVGKLVVT
jgi:hypothetical protein